MPRSSQSELAAEHGVRVRHAAERPEREHVLVLHARAAAAGRRVDVLAADRAGGAAVAGHVAELVQLLGGEARRLLERGGAEVPRGQRVDRVEGEEVGERAELAVLLGGGTERQLAQRLCRGQHGRRVGERRLHAGAAHRHGLQPLGAHHGAEPAAAGVATVVRDGGEAHQALARRADRRHAPGRAEPLAQALLGGGGGQAPEVARGLHARAVAIHQQDRGLLARAAHDDRVVARELALDGEVARGERVVQQARERRLRHHGELRARGERRADQGENTNASGASGPSGSTSGGASRCISQVPSPAPPMQPRRTGSGSSSALGVAAAHVDHERAAEVAAGGVIGRSLPGCPRGAPPAGARRAGSAGPGRRRAAPGGCPRTDDASSSSSAAAIRSSDSRSSRAGCSASTRARTVPGSWRPSSGGVMRCVPSTMNRFAYAASSTSPSRSSSSGTASRRPASSSSSRRSRHLCAPRPPGRTAGESVTGSGAGSAASGSASISTRAGRPGAAPAASRARPRGHAQARERRRGGGRHDSRGQIVRQLLPVQRAHAALEPGEVRAGVDRRAAAHEQRLEDAEGGVGPVGSAGERRDRRHAAHARLLDQPRARRRDHRARLHEALLELALGHGVGHDPAARAHPDALVADLERPDRHVQLEPGHRARVAERAGVRLAAAGLELGDHAHRLDLRRAGHRAGREAGAQQVGVAGVGPKRARHGRDQVPHARRGPRLGERRHADRAVLAHAPEVVAHQVHDHHVLGAVLRRCGEGGAVVLGARALAAGGEHPRRRALDRLAHDLAAAAAQEQLRGEAAHGAPRAGHDPGVARLERARGAREQVERVALPLGLEPEAQVRLEDLAGGDALAALVDRGHVARAARRRRLEGADPHRPLAHSLREPRAQQLEPGAQLGVALVGPERLEPPAAVGGRAGAGGRRRRA